MADTDVKQQEVSNEKPEKKKNKKDLEIEALKQELEQKNDLLLRTAAEFDNFKKRNPKIHENTMRFIEEVLNYLYPICQLQHWHIR